MPRPDFGGEQHAATPAGPPGRPDFGEQHAAGAGGDTMGRLLGATGATIGGIEKGLASWGAPPIPGLASLREADPQGPVATWAKTEDQNYPTAEKAGRLAAEYGPLMMLPELGGVRAASKIIPELPRLARVAGKGAEGLWKGAVGGATQGDTKTGAEVGGGTAAGTAAFMAAPNWLKTIIGLGALEGGRDLAGGGRLPWGMWHFAHPLALLAATALGKFPGVTGALGAKAFGDDGGDQTK